MAKSSSKCERANSAMKAFISILSVKQDFSHACTILALYYAKIFFIPLRTLLSCKCDVRNVVRMRAGERKMNF